MKKNSIKYSRMNEEVMHVISQIIAQDIKDPRIAPMTSVLSVDVTPDLKFCKVYVSVLGTKEERINTEKGLKSAAPHIRYELAKRLNMRNTPELTFVMDESIEYGINMSKKIDELMKKEENNEEKQDTEE